MQPLKELNEKAETKQRNLFNTMMYYQLQAFNAKMIHKALSKDLYQANKVVYLTRCVLIKF